MVSAAIACATLVALAASLPFGAAAAATGLPRHHRLHRVPIAATAGRTAAEVTSRLALDGIDTGDAGSGQSPTAPSPPGLTIALASLHLPVPIAPVAVPSPLVPLVTLGPPAVPPSGGVWAELRQCESGGDYAIDTGNGYYGAYQFSLQTWHGLGYPGLPSDAPPAVQDQAASRLQARSGWGQWPACSRRLGL
jgi:hypothetical protein